MLDLKLLLKPNSHLVTSLTPTSCTSEAPNTHTLTINKNSLDLTSNYITLAYLIEFLCEYYSEDDILNLLEERTGNRYSITNMLKGLKEETPTK